jgi:hypothetical protein
MTNKHFIALADMIKGKVGHHRFNDDVINDLANFCQEQNPRFNKDRWVAYINGECGKNGGKVKRSTVTA